MIKLDDGYVVSEINEEDTELASLVQNYLTGHLSESTMNQTRKNVFVMRR